MTGISNITKFSALDYPDSLATIIWFAGCNMRCSYCYNPDIVFSKGHLTENDVFSFLKTRIGKLEGVVLSGGECTLYKDIEKFCREIKAMGFKIKIDTNGTRPNIIENLINKNLIDYIALDYKAPKYKYKEITKNNDFELFSKTLNFLIKNKFNFEVRTTVHTLLLSENDIEAIITDLESRKYHGTYFLQNFLNDTKTIGNIENQLFKIDLKRRSNLFKIEFRNFNI